jgi:threonine dehydrogenase-like Zn-dependent dehydrogenase
VVWAVLDHNSDFAAVPEPSTMALVAAGGIGLIVAAWRRRKGALPFLGAEPEKYGLQAADDFA